MYSSLSKFIILSKFASRVEPAWIAQQGRNASRLYIIIYLDFRLVVSVTSLIVMSSCFKASKQHDFHWVHYHVLFMKGWHVYSFCR